MPASPRRRSTVSLLAFLGITAAAAATGARYSAVSPWYRSLKKPPFQPPPQVFGPVWTVLYVTIAISGWRVWRKRRGARAKTALALWGTQLVLNTAWSWLFFGEHRPKAALGDLVALQAANVGYVAAAAPLDPAAAWLFAPYLAWVTFAGVLNEEIVRLNP